MENKDLLTTEENKEEVMMTIGGFENNTKSKTKTQILTNIDDDKKIYNLSNKVDCLLNDYENEEIEVDKVMIKIYTKPLQEPIINEETGEIEKEFETSMSCVILATDGVSYATGSKMFAIQLKNYLAMREMTGKINEPFKIKIIKKKVNNNKALSFELI